MRNSLGILLIAVVLAGCVSKAPSQRSESTEPRYGGTLIFAKGKDATRLDPADITDAESSTVTENIFEGLVRFKPESTILEPALATSWTVSQDGLSYRFTLRKGVRFHDGTPFDAAAAKFNFDRQNTPESGQMFEYWQYFFEPVVKEVRVLDDHTLEVRLKQTDATFLSNLALATMGMLSPRAVERRGVDVARHPVGTGPFKFKSWMPNEKIVLVAHEEYWDGRPYLDKLIFKPVPENSVRLLELEVGAIAGMDGINPDDVGRVKEDPELAFYSQAGMNVGYLALNNEKAPFDSLKVRQAVRYAINKPGLVQAFFAGGTLGEAATVPMPPTIWGYHTGLQDYAYDPAKAKRLLAEAGYPNGFEMTLWSLPVVRPYMPQGQRTAEAIQADLAKVGIRATITTYEWGTYLDKLGKGDHHAALIGWIGDNGDPDNFLYTLLDANNARHGGASNYSFYKGAEAHRLMIEARQVAEPIRRAELYRKAQEVIHRDTPMIPLFHAKQLAAFRKTVRNFKLHPTGKKYFARVWLAE